MFDVSAVPRSARARFKTLVLPLAPSSDIAYFCGLLAGDGHIAIREKKNDYYLTCEGNPKDEKELYHQIVVPLVKRLFNIEVLPRSFDHTYGIMIRSKALVMYLTQVLGLPSGRKYAKLRIPEWVKDSGLVSRYIQGVADTDFCLSLKKRNATTAYYPVVSGCSESQSFIQEIACELERLGFTVSKHYACRYPDSRLKAGFAIHNRIAMYGPTQLALWMIHVGFQSPKHLRKLRLWLERNESSPRKKVQLAIDSLKKAPARIPDPAGK